MIAIERPPPGRDRQLAAGVAGAGFDGTLSSDSTRMRGYALSTDIAPTILERLGLPVPDEMSGRADRGHRGGRRRASWSGSRTAWRWSAPAVAR